MKLGSKITAFVLSCFLLQGQVYAGTTEQVDAKEKLEATMKAAQGMLESAAGHNFTTFLNLVDGNDTSVNDSSPIESQVDLGNSRLIVVEKKDGKLVVIASRRGASEVGLDLTSDPVHQEIIKQLNGDYSGTATVYYADKTSASFQVLAWGVGKLDEKHSGDIYVATETKIDSIPAGQVDANASAIAAAKK